VARQVDDWERRGCVASKRRELGLEIFSLCRAVDAQRVDSAGRLAAVVRHEAQQYIARPRPGRHVKRLHWRNAQVLHATRTQDVIAYALCNCWSWSQLMLHRYLLHVVNGTLT
jgi:hypothetical protein